MATKNKTLDKLANYATREEYSRGRKFKEPEHPYRGIYQRDRDRVIHSAAFRRLEYKTQVFVNHEGDYYRTRLTHTLEVSQIARTIARALSLNEDLVEAISLAHDLGHTPFGHSGEDALAELMKDNGGFNHNLQGLRVVDLLEERYPQFKGLNLTWEVREGIVKHSTVYDRRVDIEEFYPKRQPTLEAQVVDIADEIAYDNHDLDDGLTSGLITEKSLKKVSLWEEVQFDIDKKYPNLEEKIRKHQLIRALINILVTDIIKETKKRLATFAISSYSDVSRNKGRIVSFSKKMFAARLPLKEFLLKNLYQHYRVVRMSDKARRFIEELFNVYIKDPKALPESCQEKLKKENMYRVICDYIAGMTDRYALDEYKKLFDPYEKV